MGKHGRIAAVLLLATWRLWADGVSPVEVAYRDPTQEITLRDGTLTYRPDLARPDLVIRRGLTESELDRFRLWFVDYGALQLPLPSDPQEAGEYVLTVRLGAESHNLRWSAGSFWPRPGDADDVLWALESLEDLVRSLSGR